MNTTNEVVIQAANVAPKSQVRTVADGIWFPIRDIVTSEDARQVSPDGIDNLAADMDRQGQLESALLIREADGTHKLVFGNRRLAAARKLGWEKVKVDIKENVSESERLQMILAENGEREDASPFYTGMLYKKIQDAEKLELPALAQKLGKDRSLVGKYLSLTSLVPAVQESGNRFPVGLRHWLEIAKLPKPEDQVQLAQECLEKDYSVRELQARVKQLLKPEGTQAKAPKASPAFQFHWKGRELHIKVRPFNPDQEAWNEYACALDDAAAKYRAAFPAPELAEKPEVTVSAAA